MNKVIGDYQILLEQFLVGAMNVDEFQTIFMNRFQNEEREYSESLYEILDEIFGDVDSYTTDQQLLSEKPDFYLDEKGLKENVRKKAERLKSLAKLE